MVTVTLEIWGKFWAGLFWAWGPCMDTTGWRIGVLVSYSVAQTLEVRLSTWGPDISRFVGSAEENV